MLTIFKIRGRESFHCFSHTAFATTKEGFDLVLEKMQDRGVRLRLGPIAYGVGRTLYFFDSEGHLLHLGDRG